MQEPFSDQSFYNDLEETLREAWRLLSRGVADRRSPFHTPSVATVRVDGTPSVRTVVLRACKPENRLIRFHTDARSPKVAEIARNADVAMLFYDAAQKIQIRIEGAARLHRGDALAEECWQASRLQSRQCYRVPVAPGSALSDPADAGHELLAEDEARRYFTVVAVEVRVLEWLYLAIAGHRRARFHWSGAEWQGAWLAP